MSGKQSKHSTKRNRSARAKARGRAIGLGGGAGAFLAFGLSPLASAPPAHADGLDAILDPIINSILNSVTDSVVGLDALLGIDPTTALDSIAGLDALFGIDPTTGLDLATPATDAAAAVPSGWETLWTEFTNPSSLSDV
ncbi:MAG TPA: hypothetical protein VGG53_01525, partial [Mycobacterium sp.]|uniref:hypothetical protein n=1 Tax=Mycobacterium sp. TaxID=1785 RepID=UPI002F42AFE2